MIMQAMFYKSIGALGAFGLLAATELPGGWLQLGVAGASLFVLLWSMNINARERRDMLQAHAQTVEKFEGLVRDILNIQKPGKP